MNDPVVNNNKHLIKMYKLYDSWEIYVSYDFPMKYKYIWVGIYAIIPPKKFEVVFKPEHDLVC